MSATAGQLRSLLYVPAHRTEWAEGAVACAADAVLFDLEDAVPANAKERAAEACRGSIEQLAGEGRLLVRINPIGGNRWLDDLEAVVVPGLDGIVLPKCESPGQVSAADLVIAQLERRSVIEPGSVSLTPMFESGLGLDMAKPILAASPRVAYCWAGHTLDGDLGRDLRWGWSPEGTESLYARSKVIVDARVAGVPYPTTGVWSAIEDTEGLRRYAEQSSLLGFTGIQIIHPSHAEIVNRAFTPDATETARLERIVIAMREAETRGDGAVVLDGAMVDEAMAGSARRRLTDAAALGVEVSEQALRILDSGAVPVGDGRGEGKERA